MRNDLLFYQTLEYKLMLGHPGVHTHGWESDLLQILLP